MSLFMELCIVPMPVRAAALIPLIALATAALAEPRPSIAMRGEPALPADFKAFPYVDADAPQGGSVAYAVLDSFDSLNPFIIGGAPSPGTNTLIYETLMRRSQDEPFSLYPLLAQTIETPDDRSWVEFKLDPHARFSDGKPVTTADVAFSFELLKTRGRPQYRTPFALVKAVEVKDDRTIRFQFFDGSNRELPLILAGSLVILPKHAIDPDTFERTTLKPMIGSGPYVFADIRPGQRVLFRKNPDWWGRDLPSNRGLFNFKEIRYDFFRDDNAMFEAFKTGGYDVRPEGEAARWATEYDFPAVREGRVRKQEIVNGLPKAMSALVFNTRREIFHDPLVREALATVLDFEWINRNLYFGLYARTCSFFEASVLSSCGRPADDRERALLAPFPDAVRPDVAAGTWRPPVSDGSGRDRVMARRAIALLKQAGWAAKDGVMQSASTGQPLRFEMVLPDQTFMRLALTYAEALKRIGVQMQIRLVDSAQYQRRKQNYDFDMTQFAWQSSLSPGIEQLTRWGSQSADVQAPGYFNFAGVKSPAVDAMIKALLAARTEEDMVAATRALDRVLISGHYVVPLFYAPKLWIARWDRTVRPDKPAQAVGAYGDVLASDPILAHMRSTP
ncbi:extracellular solute-binding protein [Labrys wisconsinensis]|uniref:Peptide/nickel transport system substrate-binding protein n=1 Tax=Labrys wisconsinensis TaxID=425677 RepID=A0ABU0J3F9_9HYPH|nr:extracellular solute-binding protein [Labrys wisconsinensis]MDQ0468804.1 peptide/nickel transport system substrate-binding protein [Labrys wisconsinensis]